MRNFPPFSLSTTFDPYSMIQSFSPSSGGGGSTTEKSQMDPPGPFSGAASYTCRLDKDWTLVSASDNFFDLSGYEELVESRNLHFRQIIHPDDWDEVQKEMQAARLRNEAYNLSYRLITQSGAIRWVKDVGHFQSTLSDNLALRTGFLSDVTTEKETEERLQALLQRLQALRQVDLAILSTSELRPPLEVLLRKTVQLLQISAACAWYWNPNSQMLEYQAGYSPGHLMPPRPHLRMGESPPGRAAAQRQMVMLSSQSAVEREFRRWPALLEAGFSFYIALPLSSQEGVNGVLEIFHTETMDFQEDRVELLDALAGQAAIAIQNSILFQTLQRTSLEMEIAFDSMLESWAKVLELRQQEPPGHSHRVVQTSERLATLMELPEDQIKHIRRGAFLHDIGKLGIPDRILHKEGPLTEEEWQVVRMHPQFAYQLLSSIPNLRQALYIPYCHHEHWDGSGYPLGLKQEDIPLEARLFAPVDVWDSLLSNQTYRPAWEEAAVLEYIRQESGKLFDPEITNRFLELLAQDPDLTK